MTAKYIIITPAKNEERFIEHTIESICDQKIKPHKWIIVDDGSTDQTSVIIEKYMDCYPWIILIKNDNFDEKRAGGPKVVRAFYKGYDAITDHNYNFIVKLDADLTLPNNYFEAVSRCFTDFPTVGICGGYCVNKRDGKLVKEKAAEFHVRGAFKAYRKECFADIGGIKPVWDWDGLDQMTAMYLGWEVRVLPLAIIHHRETSKEYNRILHSLRSGKEYYRVGNGLLLGLVKSAFIIVKRPFFIGGTLFLFGFLIASLNKTNKIVNDDLAKFIRKFQYNRIARIFSKFFKKGK